jgi:MalT-like TPR region
LGALRALALEARGEDAAALTALADALGLAGPEGNMRVLVDQGMPMARLLGGLVATIRTGRVELPDAVPPDYLDRLGKRLSQAARGPLRAPTATPLGRSVGRAARWP